MKKLALVIAATAAIFAVVPASAQNMHRDGMHRGSMNRMRPHVRPHHNIVRSLLPHRHRGHVMR